MALGQYSGGFGAIAGGIIGGLIGSFYGQTYSGAMIGASLGGMAGGVAGAVLWPEKISAKFPPPPQPNENRQQISTYGSPIPIVYESSRLAGNIIYMQDVNQTVTRSKHRTDGVRYYEITNTYASTFAIAFCEGPVIGISRIWVNGKIFADWRDPASPYYPSGSTGLASANLDVSVALAETWFTTYLGTETQTADPTLVSILTDAETPAYRGICYIVFINFPVGEYSGVPTIEIEIGEAATGYTTVSLVGWTEIDLEYSSEEPANFLTLSSDGYALTNALDAYTSAESYSNPYGTGAVSRMFLKFVLSDFSGSGTITPTMIWFQDSTGFCYVNLVLGINSVEFRFYRPGGHTAKSYTSVSFPFTRWVEFDFTTAGTAVAKIYTDAFSTLEETITITPTNMAANPTFTYGKAATVDNDSNLNFTLTVSSLQKEAA